MNKNLIVATQTLYLEDMDEIERVRYKLALQTIEKTVKSGIPILIIDGDSPDYMIEEFIKRGAKMHGQKGKTYAGSVKQGFKAAYDEKIDHIVWTQIEKVSLIKDLEKIISPLGYSHLVIPSRNKKLRKESYPEPQFLLEEFTNIYWNLLTGKKWDITFGVMAMNRDISKLFIEYDESNGSKWECLQLPLIDALKKDIKFENVELDIIYPLEQKNLEMNNLRIYRKRMEQLNSVVCAWERYLKKDF